MNTDDITMNTDEHTFVLGLVMSLSISVMSMIPHADRQRTLALVACVMGIQNAVILTLLYFMLPYVDPNARGILNGIFLALGFSPATLVYAVPALHGVSHGLWRLPKTDQGGVKSGSLIENLISGIFMFVIYIVIIATTTMFLVLLNRLG